MPPDVHLSPSETARRFGVSVKALRLYERRGLLQPLRSEAGWRTCAGAGWPMPTPLPRATQMPYSRDELLFLEQAFGTLKARASAN